jgi:sensor domain CHASE-containing protein
MRSFLNKFFDSEKQYSTASPIDFNILIDSHPKLISNNDQNGVEGFISHQGHIMIVASKPILSSFEEGPSKGSMIFLKLMDQSSLKEISSLALNKINLYTVSEIQQTIATFPDVTEMEEDVIFQIQGSESLSGYKISRTSNQSRY